MRKLTIAFIATALLANVIMADESIKPIKEEGVKYIKMLGQALKKEVISKMKEDPTGALAMGFCSTKAQQITEKINNQLPDYADVRRTALKVRNPKNAPDATDTQVMEAYQKAIEEGKFNPKETKMVEVNDTYRIYKPLVTKKLCLTCHGANISDDIRAVLKKVYPNDKATGFKEGDLRGVIVAEIKKD
jgi:hypothetical protein